MAGTDGWTNLHDNNDTSIDYRGNIVLPSNGSAAQNGGAGGIGADGLNIPSKPTTQGALGANTQAGRRWHATLFDRHRTGPSGRFPNGRPWTGVMELSANPDLKQEPGFVTSDLMQGEYVADENDVCDRRATFRSHWGAPWTPLAKYFRFNFKRRFIDFAYAQIVSDEQRAMDDYFEAAAKMAAGMNGIAVEYGQTPPFAITGVLGSPISYIRNIKIAQAAQAGDPWILGHIDEPNAELAKILGFNERTGMRQLSYTPPEQRRVVTPEQVLATPDSEIAKLVADAVAKALETERAARKAKTAKARAALAKKQKPEADAA